MQLATDRHIQCNTEHIVDRPHSARYRNTYILIFLGRNQSLILWLILSFNSDIDSVFDSVIDSVFVTSTR